MSSSKDEFKEDFTFEFAETLKQAIPLHVFVGIDMFYDVVTWFCQRLLTCDALPSEIKKKQWKQATLMLEDVWQKLTDRKLIDDKCVTPFHTGLLSLYMRLCEIERAYSIASKKFTTVYNPKENSDSMLLFFYYSGTVFLWKKEYEAAENRFELVCFSPRLDKIYFVVVSALRKLILTSLILRGYISEEVSAIARSLSNSRDAQSLSPYIEKYIIFADAYKKLKLSVVLGWFDSHRQELKKDGNLGLSKMAVCHFYRHLVVKMQSLYSVCTIQQMLEFAGAADSPDKKLLENEVHDAVSALQHSGVGVSFVDPESKIVIFEQVPFPPSFSSRESVTDFEQRVNSVLQLTRDLDVKRENQKPVPAKEVRETLAFGYVDDVGGF